MLNPLKETQSRVAKRQLLKFHYLAHKNFRYGKAKYSTKETL